MTRFNKGFALLALLSLSTAANSYCGRIYIGAQIGKADTGVASVSSNNVSPDIYDVASVMPGSTFTANSTPYTIQTATVNSISLDGYQTSVNSRVVAGHIYVGYQLYDQLAFELGYLHLRDQTSSYTSTSVVGVNGNATTSGFPVSYSTNFNAVTRKDTYSDDALDLNVKAIVPINEYFNIYAKIGAAYLRSKDKTVITLQNSSNILINGLPATGSMSFSTSSTSNTSRVYPAIGLGAAYHVNPNADIDLSWYRIISRGSSISNIDILFLGFTYSLNGLFAD